jgi:CheY-like chemotaxis protein
MSDAQQVTIVMIEDDEGHATLIEKNLRRAGISNDLTHFDNGRKALEYFTSTGDYEGQKLPESLLILLDLNLPEVDGFEILKTLKSNPATHLIPIIILTTTDNPREIERAYELGCNIYVTKPVVYDNFAESIRKLGLMLAVVKVPGVEM